MSFDWDAAADDLRAIRAENEVSLALRRGSGTVAAQDMRIEYAGARAFQLQSAAARSARQALFILGEPDMDIQIDDRLTYNGSLLKITFVQPNRLAATIAEAVIEE